MNSRIFSVIVSCLLSSNFFIGFGQSGLVERSLAAQSFGPSRLVPGVGLSRLVPSAGQTRLVKRGSEPTLDLTLSVLNDILIIRNTTSNRAILIDTEQDVILLLDGGESSGIVISQKRNKGNLIPDGLWDADQQSLTEYLSSIDNDISTLLNRPSGTDCSIPRVHISILTEIKNIVVDLVVSIVPELEQRPELALELVLSVATGIDTLLEGSLKGILAAVGDQQIQLSIDISGVLNVLQGVDTLNGYLDETAQDVITRNGKIDIGNLLGARDGLAALSDTLRVLSEIDDLSALNDLLGNPESLAKLIAQFGGNSNVGITGVFRVVGEILAYANGNSKLERVISILIQVVAESSEVVKDDLSSHLRNSLSNLLETLKQIRCTETLNGLVTIVQDLLKEQLVVDGVNISDIISTILAGVIVPKEKLLGVIVTVLQSLSPIVDPSQSIPKLLFVLIVQLDSATGIRNLISLGLDLGRPGCICSLLEAALEAIEKLIDELSEDLYAASCELPIISNIILVLEAVLEIENLNLKELLLSASETQELIVGVFQLVSEVELGVAVIQLEAVTEILSWCNGLATLVAIDVTVTIVVIT
ncbi:unnamed protein product [Ceutorhynchus assimilis]|uniref:Uncharacterized protein n=1 Tax=Ceutorhynchus assimilis TaxID=467358 RepID=A0A9N9MT33_9CUCU|nr:unnamed protein product [Ceutorhynchus assimilis]